MSGTLDNGQRLMRMFLLLQRCGVHEDHTLYGRGRRIVMAEMLERMEREGEEEEDPWYQNQNIG